MNKGEEKKIHEILESGSIGYAYLFDAKARKTLEKVVSLEPEIWRHCSESMGQRWSGCL